MADATRGSGAVRDRRAGAPGEAIRPFLGERARVGQHDRNLGGFDQSRSPPVERAPGKIEREAAGDPRIVARVLDGGGAPGADRGVELRAGRGRFRHAGDRGP